jgi:site-specific DNA-methyltransferase (adenine-specific)
MSYQIMHGDCQEQLQGFHDNTFDAVVTDPPYALTQHSQKDIENHIKAWLSGGEYKTGKKGFCAKSWDSFVPSPGLWKSIYRVLKPGGHILAFAGSRTYDLMGLAIRLAGFQIRDGVFWQYTMGMPRGMNISKAIDAYYQMERKPHGPLLVGGGKDHTKLLNGQNGIGYADGKSTYYRTLPVHALAKQFEDWNTALKPTCEPIVLAQKPVEGTIVENILKWGVGALNIGACRIGEAGAETHSNVGSYSVGKQGTHGAYRARYADRQDKGRWPGNTLFSHHPLCQEGCIPGCVVQEHQRQHPMSVEEEFYGIFKWEEIDFHYPFQYVSKPTVAEKETGLEDLPIASVRTGISEEVVEEVQRRNHHPTVKPVAMMRWLIDLVTPPGGKLLEPFAGSGTTGVAAMQSKKEVVLIEAEANYLPIIEHRLDHAVRVAYPEKEKKEKAKPPQVSLF